ncbi:phage tail tape measure protein [Bacillus cereus]|uniref:Phage tail tape measure protein, TP901 family, core region n=1 Tax=Bacillus cereus TIAC219 TaxID=718222 RepID=A0ABC9SPF0_BACCE|nr:phage tail tape measure protein [Bacillus cereus]EJP81288.1 phage tail tape measure protein, TP901 family, core region [Bacillus cereus VD022]EOQ56195.1 phage tail tape measure protein, TP901 family, core region [Bacillus cereus TIAC219]
MSNVGKTTIQIQSDSSQARRDYEAFFRFVENGLKRLENVARSTDPLQTLANKTSQHTATIIEQLNRVGATAESVFRRIDAAGRGSGAGNSLNRQLQQTQQALTATDQRARQSGSAFNELDGKIRVLTAQLQSASTGMGGFSNSTEQLRGRMEIMRNLTDQYRIKLEQLREKHRAAASAEGENAQSTQRYAEQIHRTTTEINRLDQSMTNAQTQLNQQTSMIGRFTNGMENMGQRMQNFGMTMTTTFGTATYGLGRFLKSAVEESMNFEQQMANIKAVSGATADTMDELSKLAVKYGEDTKYSSVEAGKGIEELIKAGVSLTDIINGGLEGALNLATAGELDLGDAAQIASTALNAFKADNLSVTDAANLLAGAANASATNVKEMQYGLSMVSAVAAGVGLSFKDTSTALALFAQNGLRGSDAGTSLKTMMANLIPKSKEAYELFSELGLISFDTGKAMQYLSEKGVKPASNSYKDIMVSLEEYAAKQAKVKVGSSKAEEAFKKLTFSTGIMHNAFFDANGNLKGMADIAEVVQMAMEGLTAEQRQSYLYTLFGSDAIRAANILYKEGADGIKNMYGEMSKVTALDVANTKMETTKGQIEELSGAYDTLKKTIGDALLPTVRMIVSAFQGLVDWFNNLDKSTQETIAGTGLLVVALMGVAGVVGVLSLALGALIANPIALAITGAVLGLGLLGAAVMKVSNDVKQTTEDYDKFGGVVSEGTRKAAGAYVDLKDKAINNMILLKTQTGEEAQKAANQTIEIFKEMTNKVVQELESKKNGFNKMFAELMQVVPESTKDNLERVQKAVIDGLEAEKKVAIEAGKILEEGIKKFNGDVSKMPRDFAQKFNESLTVLDKNTKVFYQKSKEIAQLTQQIGEGGTLTYGAAKKNFETFNKAFSDGIDGLKKKTKEWRESIEKDTTLDPTKRKTALDSIELYEKQHTAKLQKTRLEGYNALLSHMSQEDMQRLAHNAKMIEIEDKGWLEKIKVALERGEDASEVFKRYLDETEKSEKAYQDKSLQYEAKYTSAKIESLGMYIQELQKGNDSSRVLAENIARNIDGKLKVDLGPAGQYTIETFLEKIKKGEIDAEQIATANANKLKEVYKVDLSQSGIDSMKKWIDGIKSKDTAEVREFLGSKLQGDTVIDLGIYGKMTVDTWITGLQQGTLSFDTVFQYFHDQVKAGMKVDNSEEGINNVQTLINGMKIGAIAIPEAAQLIGLDIKNNSKIDLGEEGQFTVATLVEGLQNGSINAEIAVKAIAELIKGGAKLDLTQVGSDTSQTQANGISGNTSPEIAATNKKNAVESILGGTTDSGGGNKAGQELGDGIMSKRGFIKGSALDSVAAAHEGFNTINGQPSGNKGGVDFASGIHSQKESARNTAQGNAGAAEQGFGTINGDPLGLKGGNGFAGGLRSTRDTAQNAGSDVASAGERGLKSSNTESLGSHFASGFSSGIRNGKSLAQSAGEALASTAFEAARRWLEVRSPSRKVKREIGFHFGTGFAAGIGESTRTVVTASRNLAQSAFSMLDRFTDDADGTAFAAPFVNNVSSMTDKVMTHFQTFENKLTNAMDNVKDILDQNLSGDINLDVATENIKKTLNKAQMNLSDKFLYKPDNKVPALSADMPNLNQIITAAQPTASNDREINLTVNLTSLMDGQEVAKITAPYTTEIQEREKEQRSRFKG